MVVGARKGFGTDPMEPHNIPTTVMGAALLWFGWFGFNAGSALAANGIAANAFVTTNTAAAAAATTWMILSWRHRAPSALGIVTGAVAGLAAITPASGFVTPLAAIPIGVGAAIVGYYSILIIRGSKKVDDSLDVLACHGMGSTWGVLATGFFASIGASRALCRKSASGGCAGNRNRRSLDLLICSNLRHRQGHRCLHGHQGQGTRRSPLDLTSASTEKELTLEV